MRSRNKQILAVMSALQKGMSNGLTAGICWPLELCKVKEDRGRYKIKEGKKDKFIFI